MNEAYLQKLCGLCKIDLLTENAAEIPSSNEDSISPVSGTDASDRRSKDSSMTVLFGTPEDSPLYQNAALRTRLQEGCRTLTLPFILQEEFNVFFACFFYEQTWYYIGPVTTGQMTSITRRKFYQSFGILDEDVHSIPHFSLQEIIDFIQLVYYSVTSNACSDQDLLSVNHLEGSSQKASIEKELSAFVMREEEANDEEAYRHTYHEEQKLLQAVSEGRSEDALQRMLSMDSDSGRLATHELSHWKNLAVVGISLCTRAAIGSGISPETGYRISGFYIQKCDSCKTPAQILHYRNQAILELTAKVAQRLSQRKSSSYTERCKDYINKHYREKIYLDSIAAILGISPTYLSRLFKKDSGDSIQDYINQVRTDRAANLLIYSDESLPDIAVYVHFPSQSYFGKIFLKYKKMTPKQYRDRYKASEFIEEHPSK